MGFVVFAIIIIAAGFIVPVLPPMRSKKPIKKNVFRMASVTLGLVSASLTSFVIIPDDSVGVMTRIYAAASMKPGQIVALKGQKGPQAELLPPGFNFRPLLRVLNDITYAKVTVIPEGSYGLLTAADGKPLASGQYMAPRWKKGTEQQMLDAEYFLLNDGHRGPQLNVLTPGTYRLNPNLFHVKLDKATDIAAGAVGVIKSNVQEAETWERSELKLSEADGSLAVPLVKKGSVGVWDTPLPSGRYYLNLVAYNVTLVDIRAQTWNYKGGYKRRHIDLTVGQDGRIEQKKWEEDVLVPESAADAAITTRMEGWPIPQELRVQVQVEPRNAPILVASVGTIDAAEDKIVTPAIRSVVRNVCAAEEVMSLLNENRTSLENDIEQAVIPEGLKAGVTIKDVRLVESAIPPELMVARLRRQLADQLKATYKQEQIAQHQRIETEKARATADQQPEIVKAEIRVQVAEKTKQADKLAGEGQKLKLQEIAAGQKAQVAVLGEDRVMQLAMLDKILQAAVANPDIVKVPSVSVSGSRSGIEGAAAVLGNSTLVKGFIQPSVVTPVEDNNQ